MNQNMPQIRWLALRTGSLFLNFDRVCAVEERKNDNGDQVAVVVFFENTSPNSSLRITDEKDMASILNYMDHIAGMW